MSDSHIHAEWSGTSGKIKARLFNSTGRRIIEKIIFGNYWDVFYNELNRNIVSGNENILDIGAGSGNFSIPIASKLKTGSVTCLDTSEEMTSYLYKVAQAKNIHHKIKICNQNAMKTNLCDNTFDWVVFGNILHELSSPLDACKEALRVLKNKHFILAVDFRNMHGYHGGDAHGPFPVNEFLQLFNTAGFKEVEVIQKRHFVVAIAKKNDGVSL
jgi:ubiquinone/menaquinone biosynthesis C-methylase UbiE